MATVAIKILKHRKKMDGTYNVNIRIKHKNRACYLPTHHFVCDEQLSPDLTLKDPSVYNQLHNRVQKYRAAIGRLGNTLDFHSASDLKEYLLHLDRDVDFIKFSTEYIDNLLNAGRKGSARTLKTVVYSLIDYFKRDKISALEINARELIRYERYLRSERIITRACNKTSITRTVKGMQDADIHNHMRDLRIIFKAAMRFYNNPQFNEIKIHYCPFDNYKIVNAPITRKRNIKIDQIKEIRDSQATPDSRAELARDMFMLSFYLCGMNAVDIYNLRVENIVDGRVEYNRSKTRGRRKDDAFISIKIVKDAQPILDKYIGKLHLRYSDFLNLDRALNIGLK